MLAQMGTYCNYWPLCSWWCHIEHVSCNATLFALCVFCSGWATHTIGNQPHITHEHSKHPHNTRFWLTNACDWIGVHGLNVSHAFGVDWGFCIECWLLLVVCGLVVWTHAYIGDTCLTMSIVPGTQWYGNATINHSTTTIHKNMCTDVDICTCIDRWNYAWFI